MRSASMMASLQSAHYRAGSLSEATRRKALVDLVLEEARRRGRGHELAVYLGRHAPVLDHFAVAELDLQHLRLGVVADRADLARIDALAFHVHSISSPVGSQCSITNCRFCAPLNSFTESRYAARTDEGRGSSALKRIASRVRPPRASLSFRCFSPTTRWPRTSNSSQNSGCGKPWPQICSSRSWARPRSRYAVSSDPSVSTVRPSCAGDSHSRATASKSSAKRAKSSACSVRPAAAACPPKRSSSPGARLATRSSASRRCRPAIERPEPLISPGAPCANAKVGRWWRSLTRPARIPITPWCHDGS